MTKSGALLFAGQSLCRSLQRGKKSCVSETKGHLPDLHGAGLGGSGEEQQADEQRHQHAAQAAKEPKWGRCTHGGTSFYD